MNIFLIIFNFDIHNYILTTLFQLCPEICTVNNPLNKLKYLQIFHVKKHAVEYVIFS